MLHGYERNVLICFRVDKGVSQAEVDQMDQIAFIFESDHDVVWLQVSMNVVLSVDVFDAVDELVEDHQSGLEAKLFAAES